MIVSWTVRGYGSGLHVTIINPRLTCASHVSKYLDFSERTPLRDGMGERSFVVTSQPVSLTTYTQMGWTPLMISALCGKCEGVTELVENGADVNAQGIVSNTTYHDLRYVHTL